MGHTLFGGDVLIVQRHDVLIMNVCEERPPKDVFHWMGMRFIFLEHPLLPIHYVSVVMQVRIILLFMNEVCIQKKMLMDILNNVLLVF